jgi:siroheme synthase (precorrin-2 oxidase/ferrochelatase)
MELEQLIFKGKTIGNLIEDVYNQQQNQRDFIKQEIERLVDMISTPGEAIVLAPMVKDMFDSSLKNDDVLVKVLQLFQKAAEKQQQAKDDGGLLSEKDIEQLFNEVSAYKVNDAKQLPKA